MLYLWCTIMVGMCKILRLLKDPAPYEYFLDPRLNQVWKYFSWSPMRTRMLNIHLENCGSRGLKLQKACRTRWLYDEAAITTMRSEIIAVWKTLTHFATKYDATAMGLLRETQTKTFLMCVN